MIFVYIAPQALHAPTARECTAGAFSRAYGACTIVIQCNDTKVNRVCTVILWGETPHTPPPFFTLSKITNSYYTVYIFSHCNIALSSNLNWRVINCCCIWRHHFLGTSILDSTHRFVKFGRQKRTFSGEKRKKRLAESSQSDSSLAITFATFLWQNVRVFHPNLADMLGALLTCMYKQFFCLNSAKCWFCSLGRSHCKMCPLPTIRSRVFVLFATDKHARS